MRRTSTHSSAALLYADCVGEANNSFHELSVCDGPSRVVDLIEQYNRYTCSAQLESHMVRREALLGLSTRSSTHPLAGGVASRSHPRIPPRSAPPNSHTTATVRQLGDHHEQDVLAGYVATMLTFINENTKSSVTYHVTLICLT